MKKATNAQINGTCFKGVVKCSYNKLVSVFGEPNSGPSGDGKVLNEWVMETDDGDVVTIYDWKTDIDYSTEPDELYEWHIGGHKSCVVTAVHNKLV